MQSCSKKNIALVDLDGDGRVKNVASELQPCFRNEAAGGEGRAFFFGPLVAGIEVVEHFQQ
jgi:hypothetical protein